MTEQAGKLLENVARDAQAFCKRTWWVFLIGGIASVVFGILAFVNPGVALYVLALFFAAYVLVDGAVNIWGAISNRDKDGWWALLLLGILGLVIGAYALINPPVSMAALVYLVAFIALFTGVMLLLLGWRVRQATSKEWILYVTGALSLLFGILIVTRPVEGTLSVVYLIASWAILIGALRIFFAYKIRNVKDNVAERVSEALTQD
jgi:uncharacterized membrane protein HdeD (DUF308 family)